MRMKKVAFPFLPQGSIGQGVEVTALTSSQPADGEFSGLPSAPS